MGIERYINFTAKIIIPTIDHIQLVEYKNKELDFAYGMEQYHTSFRRMFKQIKRIILR